MNIGYCRVSTFEQNLDMQIDALNKYGVDSLYQEKVSGIKEHRPEWEKCFAYARPGDTIVVWRLDRIGRGHTDLLKIVSEMEDRRIELKTLTGMTVDTSTPTGKMLFRIMATLIEFERDQMRERIRAGFAAARARGKLGGRPGVTADSKKFIQYKSLVDARNPETGKLIYSVPEICDMMHFSKNTYYRWLRFKNSLESSNVELNQPSSVPSEPSS